MVSYHKRKALIMYVCDKVLSRISIPKKKRLKDEEKIWTRKSITPTSHHILLVREY
jgi:uncharacterized protein YlaI